MKVRTEELARRKRSLGFKMAGRMSVFIKLLTKPCVQPSI
jgi:hypothetical protein